MDHHLVPRRRAHKDAHSGLDPNTAQIREAAQHADAAERINHDCDIQLDPIEWFFAAVISICLIAVAYVIGCLYFEARL